MAVGSVVSDAPCTAGSNASVPTRSPATTTAATAHDAFATRELRLGSCWRSGASACSADGRCSSNVTPNLRISQLFFRIDSGIATATSPAIVNQVFCLVPATRTEGEARFFDRATAQPHGSSRSPWRA